MRIVRHGPIVTAHMLPGNDGGNINGPSLIRVPDWVSEKLGEYYLYFAHHEGKYIRMAYADWVEGPYTVHPPGTLSLAECAAFARAHLASPDVLVDTEARQLLLYFHAPARHARGQMSFLASSRDGLAFAPDPQILGKSYFRVFEHAGQWYALAKSILYRCKGGRADFIEGPNIYPVSDLAEDPDLKRPGNVRHLAVDVSGDVATIYFTRQADAPEHIRRGTLDLTRPWTEWRIENDQFVLAPEMDWEGADEPVVPSRTGPAAGAVNELRDPCIYRESGRTFLLYSYAGESGIALAEIVSD